MAGDNNTAMRSAMARHLANITGRTFTSSFSISAQTAVSAYIGELDESDMLMVAGRDRKRGIVVGLPLAAIQAPALPAPWVYDEGLPVQLDADSSWEVGSWKISPDAAEIRFLLLSAD